MVAASLTSFAADVDTLFNAVESAVAETSIGAVDPSQQQIAAAFKDVIAAFSS